jgi:CRP/FNR family cyclic AMP-dependent transcriptional regulator
MKLTLRRSDKTDLIKKVALFSELSKSHLNEISKHADQVMPKAGTVLAEQGRQGWDFVFIVKGKAKVLKNMRVIRRLKGGDYFGEISLIDGGPRTATVIAETDMTILVVHRRSFAHLLKTIPGLQNKIMLSLCTYLRRAEKDINK